MNFFADDIQIQGELHEVAKALDSIVRSQDRVRKVLWIRPDALLQVRTRAGLLTFGETITVELTLSNEFLIDIAIASETGPQWIDYGKNRKNVEWIIRSLGEYGLGVFHKTQGINTSSLTLSTGGEGKNQSTEEASGYPVQAGDDIEEAPDDAWSKWMAGESEGPP